MKSNSFITQRKKYLVYPYSMIYYSVLNFLGNIQKEKQKLLIRITPLVIKSYQYQSHQKEILLNLQIQQNIQMTAIFFIKFTKDKSNIIKQHH